MKLIIEKNSKYTIPDFFSKIINLDYIDGICLNIVKTSDNVLVSINLSTSNNSFLRTISLNNFVNLKGFEMVPLLEIMNYLKRINYQEKIFLNIIPYQPTKLTEDDSILLVDMYKEYAKLLREIIDISRDLNIYIHSISRTLIDFIRKEDVKTKFGFTISLFDLNYIDVDYYVFLVDMLNFSLIKQEIDMGKEVVIYIGTDYELSYIYDIFKGDKKTNLTEEIFENIYIIGDYPEILKTTFLPK